MTDRADTIHTALQTRFAPEHLLVKDQSHLHAGHAGAADGRGHFAVDIVSAEFSGVSRINRHRLVHECLADLLKTDIHALSIRARAPDET
ncbi:MAG: BolA family protein [Pseudomonadota bacterium]